MFKGFERLGIIFGEGVEEVFMGIEEALLEGRFVTFVCP